MSEVTLSPMPFGKGDAIRQLDSDPPPKRWLATFEGKRHTAIISRDNVAGARSEPDYRWHVSVAGEHDIPDWPALVAIVHKLRPGVMFTMPMPPLTYWMNVNARVLHVWELRDEPLAAQWQMEGSIARAAGRGTPS